MAMARMGGGQSDEEVTITAKLNLPEADARALSSYAEAWKSLNDAAGRSGSGSAISAATGGSSPASSPPPAPGMGGATQPYAGPPSYNGSRPLFDGMGGGGSSMAAAVLTVVAQTVVIHASSVNWGGSGGGMGAPPPAPGMAASPGQGVASSPPAAGSPTASGAGASTPPPAPGMGGATAPGMEGAASGPTSPALSGVRQLLDRFSQKMGLGGAGGVRDLMNLAEGFGLDSNITAMLGKIAGPAVPGGSAPPWGAAALRGAGIAAVVQEVASQANVAAGIEYNYGRAIYHAETDLLLTAARGDYISPIESARRTKIGQERAELERARAYGNRAIDGILRPLGPVGDMFSPGLRMWADQTYFMPAERQIGLDDASFERRAMEARMGAMLGRSYTFASPDSNYNKLLVESASAGLPFGPGGVGVASRMPLERWLSTNGYDPQAALSLGRAVMQYGARPENGFLPALVSGAARPDAMLSSMFGNAAFSGDFGTLGLGRNLSGDLYDRAARVSGYRLAGQMAGIEGSTLQSEGARAVALGGGGMASASSMEKVAASLVGVADALQKQLAEPGGNALQRAQLSSQLAGVQAQREQLLTGAIAARYAVRGQDLATAGGLASLGLERAMFGTEDEALSSFRRIGRNMSEQEALATERSQNGRLDQQTRDAAALEAAQLRYQIDYQLPRQQGQYQLGLRQGELGVTGASLSAASMRAGLFGGPGDIYATRGAEIGQIGEQADLVRRQLAGEFGSLQRGEELELRKRLIDLMSQEYSAREQNTRALGQASVQIAQHAQGMASISQQRGYLSGVGGVEAFGLGQRTYEAAQRTAAAAQGYLQSLQARGVSHDNPEYERAEQMAAQAQLGAEQAGLSRASQPVSIGMRRDEFREDSQLRILMNTPGSRGSIRNLLASSMETQERKAAEIEARRAAHMRANGGQLSEVEAFEYEKELAAVAEKQQGLFMTMSQHWQGRLEAHLLGAPNTFGYASPLISMKNAVTLGGVRAPNLGATPETLPYFLRSSQLYGSRAGDSTPEGQMSAAMLGLLDNETAFRPSPTRGSAGLSMRDDVRQGVVEGLHGVEITLHVPLPGGGAMSVPATVGKSPSRITNEAHGIFPTASNLAENAGRSGNRSPKQH